MSLKDMRDELRALRKEHVKPVSRMKKGDISSEIEKLKAVRSDTPAVAAVPSAPLKKSRSAVESIKAAKSSEFPVKPETTAAPKKKMMAPAAAEKPKKKSMEEKLKMALAALESDEE